MKAVVSVAACCCLLITLYSSLVPLVLPLATEEPSTTSSVSLPTAHTVTAFSLAKRLAMEHEMKRTCPHAKPLPEDPDSHEIWHRFRDTFIFSAFWDTRLEPYRYIRVVALRRLSDTAFWCQIPIKDGGLMVTPAVINSIWSKGWSQGPFTPLLVSCPVPSVIKNPPKTIGLSSKDTCDTETTVTIPVHRTPKDIKEEQRADFAVCLKSLDMEASSGRRLIEWLEALRLLGASRVFVYVYPDSSAPLRRLLAHGYSHFVTLVPMSWPENLMDRRKYISKHPWRKRRVELVPYNDCLYRSLDLFRFVVPLDVDELLVPRNHKDHTWQELVSRVGSEALGYASLTARHVYFLNSFPKASNASDSWPHMLSHITRSQAIHPGRERGKSFISTDRTLTVFNHYALTTLQTGLNLSYLMPSEWSLVHHYRSSCAQDDPCSLYLKPLVQDTTLWKYANPLSVNVLSKQRTVGV